MRHSSEPLNDRPARPLPTERPAGCPFDPPSELATLREKDPVSPMLYPDGHIGWLVTEHALTRQVLADARFGARADLVHTPLSRAKTEGGERRPAPAGVFSQMDPPQHTRYRRLLAGQFTVRRMRLLADRVREITAGRLDAMEQQGPVVDLVETFALPIPSLVICELLGVPYEDRDRFQHDTEVLMRMDTTREETIAAFVAVQEHMAELVAAKRAEPADDLLSDLVNGDGDLTDEELINVGGVLLAAGFETTANMIGLGVFALLQHPDQLAVLRDGPGITELGHADPIVEELLRYLSVIPGTVRVAMEDVVLGGQEIKAGQSVTVSIPAANHDSKQFPDPGRLDFGRPVGGHVAFGHGIHQCLGQQLARVEMQIALPALFERFPGLRLAVPPEEVPMRTDMLIYGVHRLPVTWEPVA
ncbi:cytochrome P450 [Spongiactinospora rosea]|uniref:Cytochrome P450 n=1 Tax=Spongiactinospora rosea TaxID=2248750 RepID=A0A366M5K2_9ACTN|nr:cytochrome P450 [Spongiactinospora rosea]RBQ21481.1 cytochrome P450 [Spongiactinospora rosea]